MPVDHPVTQVYQTTDNTCWAASCAMLVNTRDGSSLSDSDIVGQVGNAGGDGADEPEMQVIASALNLNFPGPASMTPQGWDQLLQVGPVMVGIPGHYVVVGGVYYEDGDQGGAESETAQLHIYDPANGESWGILSQLEGQYELDANSGANLLQA